MASATPPAVEATVAAPLHRPSIDDIATMLPVWSDSDLSRLRHVLDAEWQRRRLTGAAPAPQHATRVRQRKPESLADGLTAAQLKLIHSAAKSGVSARDIARQFGLPVAAVEHVLQASRR